MAGVNVPAFAFSRGLAQACAFIRAHHYHPLVERDDGVAADTGRSRYQARDT
jgi:hypothetical protein